MESFQSLRSRLKSVKNIGQITKAMEVVSVTKMRRSQEIALNSRFYAIKALELLKKIQRNTAFESPFLRAGAAEKTLVVIVAADKGLAGSFNSQVFKATEALVARERASCGAEHRFSCVAVGRKAIQFATSKKMPIEASFTGFGDYIETEETEPLAKFLIAGFLKGEWDRIFTVSTHFRTTLQQDVLVRQIFPVDFEKLHETIMEIIPEKGRFANIAISPIGGAAKIDYIIEPSPNVLFDQLLPRLVGMQIYHLVLEANASEHSARRVAMKSASDNAMELADGISFIYNKARQARITNELIEITSTQTALQ